MPDDKQFMLELAAKLVTENIEKLVEGGLGLAKDVKEKILVKTGLAFRRYYESSIGKYIETKTLLNNQTPVNLYSIYGHL